MAVNDPQAACSQEPRLSVLERGQEQILETLKDMKELLARSIRTEERITTASKRLANLEQRQADLERRVYSGAWVERVLLAVTAGVLGWAVRKGVM